MAKATAEELKKRIDEAETAVQRVLDQIRAQEAISDKLHQVAVKAKSLLQACTNWRAAS